MSDSTVATCQICERDLDWSNEDCFAMEFVPKEMNNKEKTAQAIFFHPECFISLAGNEWAVRCGYKLEKPQLPKESQPGAYCGVDTTTWTDEFGNFKLGEPT